MPPASASTPTAISPCCNETMPADAFESTVLIVRLPKKVSSVCSRKTRRVASLRMTFGVLTMLEVLTDQLTLLC